MTTALMTFTKKLYAVGERVSLFTTTLQKRGEKHLFATMAVMFFLSLFAMIGYAALEEFELSRDGVGYLNFVIEQNGVYSEGKKFPPLLPTLMVSLQDWLGIPAKCAGLAISMVSSAFASCIIFAGVYAMFHRYYFAVLSGNFYILDPHIRDVSCNIMRDPAALCLNLFAILCLIFFLRRKSTGWIVLSGAGIGFALGFRYENLEFIPIVLMSDAVYQWGMHTSFPRWGWRVLKDGVLFLGGFLIASAMILVFSWKTGFFSFEHVMDIIHYYYL